MNAFAGPVHWLPRASISIHYAGLAYTLSRCTKTTVPTYDAQLHACHLTDANFTANDGPPVPSTEPAIGSYALDSVPSLDNNVRSM
jgi:hypothetical protein